MHTNKWKNEEFYQDTGTCKKESDKNSRIENKMIAIKNSGGGRPLKKKKKRRISEMEEDNKKMLRLNPEKKL